MNVLFPEVSRFASIQMSSQELLSSQQEKSAEKLGFHKIIIKILNGKQ